MVEKLAFSMLNDTIKNFNLQILISVPTRKLFNFQFLTIEFRLQYDA